MLSHTYTNVTCNMQSPRWTCNMHTPYTCTHCVQHYHRMHTPPTHIYTIQTHAHTVSNTTTIHTHTHQTYEYFLTTSTIKCLQTSIKESLNEEAEFRETKFSKSNSGWSDNFYLHQNHNLREKELELSDRPHLLTGLSDHKPVRTADVWEGEEGTS